MPRIQHKDLINGCHLVAKDNPTHTALVVGKFQSPRGEVLYELREEWVPRDFPVRYDLSTIRRYFTLT
ncbi:hypothetical protein F0P96_10460 [Hymenobacter busanensis]|uniref:Uncharacterized protein n=1 Tax=Hymenobacter busanensis TaxID=2607656 RepID=A0A7L4ZXH1_9BACT|nr:hypothetical protein [Hymenobacter busanensis]KAA9333382.1 hypothetical protein F0P96_10460 [Hymenobacter busanensis]QHJ07938.1 hypothetical protein GUY19_11845 [Hymenobacter busanensis]